MSDSKKQYKRFREKLTDFVHAVDAKLTEPEGPSDDLLRRIAAELDPLMVGVSAVLAERDASMEHMKLDELLSYLGMREGDDELIKASKAAERFRTMLRWFHYPDFARPDDVDAHQTQADASLLLAAIGRLIGLGGDSTHD